MRLFDDGNRFDEKAGETAISDDGGFGQSAARSGDDDSFGNEIGDEVGEAADEVGDEVENAADEVGDEVGEAADEVGDAIDDAF